MTAAGIGIIGTINLELLLGPLSKIPGWGKQVFVDQFDMRKAGSGPSVGLVLAALGLKPRLFGTVGSDEAGAEILRHLSSKGIDVDAVEKIRRRRTGICVSLTRNDGAHCYISSLDAIAATTCGCLMRHQSTLDACGTLLLTGYFALPGLGFQGTRRLFKRLRRQGKTIALDPGWDPQGWPAQTREEIRELLQYVNIFLPNQAEARILSGKRTTSSAARALQALGPDTVFVKLESRGGLVVAGGRVVRHRGFPRAVRDTTAAGEAFNAGALFGLSHGLEAGPALALANAAAARFVEAGDPEACTLQRVLALLGDSVIKKHLRFKIEKE